MRVALPVPVDRLFDYALPRDSKRPPSVGTRVRVAVGNRRMTGLVVEPADVSEVAREKLRPIQAVLDEHPVISPALIEVLRAEARAVLCPIGLALHAALPSGSTPRSVAGFRLTPRGEAARESGAVSAASQAVLDALAGGGRTAAELQRAIPVDEAQLQELARDGLVAATPLERAARVRAARVRVAAPVPGIDLEACFAALRRAPRQAEVLRHLAAAGPTPLPALADAIPGASAAVRALSERGWVHVEERAVAAPMGLRDTAPPVTLTGEQQRACDAIGAAVGERRSALFLLHGVTGSGKTEVYLRAIADALAAGRQALVLVPEITLTHQIIGRLRARFGDQLAILHSGLKPSERLAQWERLRAGATPIAVGARSALFAPMEDLGVIVVDEEHEPAYKSEEGFRYHARSLATRRAVASACPLVLGSATPSLETRYAAERGAVERLVLDHRVGTQPLPAVELVDLARERAALPRGRKLILSAPLRRAMRRTLEDGAQTILFLNRRGFSTQIACFSCGRVERCKDCDIALTFHAGEGSLRCHYCDHQAKPPDVCAGCGAPDTALLGIGTERLEEEVRIHFPEARIARLDRDIANRRGATEEVLASLRDGELDILVGTQMVAKGHDFPGVRLVGVINADLGLHFPDFRAAERTFQLLTQVAGRAGRSGSPGRVVIQTWSPDHYAIRPVLQHDYEGFYREELQHRRGLGYPPCGQLAQVRVSSEDEGMARVGAERLARVARETGVPVGCEVLGPAPSPIARLRGRHRLQILIRHPERATVWRITAAVQDASAELPSGVRASVDVAPTDML